MRVAAFFSYAALYCLVVLVSDSRVMDTPVTRMHEGATGTRTAIGVHSTVNKLAAWTQERRVWVGDKSRLESLAVITQVDRFQGCSHAGNTIFQIVTSIADHICRSFQANL